MTEKLCSEFKIDEASCDNVEFFYRKRVSGKVTMKHLSHLVSSVEDMINEKIRVEGGQFTKQESETSRDVAKITKSMRVFSIVLVPVDGYIRKARSYLNENVFLIYYDARFEKMEIRVLVAHEIGHLVGNKFLDGNDTENVANTFAFYALHDKNEFYKNDAKNFTFPTDGAIISKIAALCPITESEQASDMRQI